MAESNREPPLCPCGFWGSTQTSGLCSKCYKEMLKRKECPPGSSGSTTPSTNQPSNPVRVVVTPASPNHPSSSDGILLSSHPTPKWSKEKNENETGTRNSNKTEARQDSPKTADKSLVNSQRKTLESSQDTSKTVEASQDNAKTYEDQIKTSESKVETIVSLKLHLPFSDVSSEDPSSGPATDRTSNDKTPTEDKSPERTMQKNKKKCFKCRCKLDLASSEIGRCKCDYVFCENHRLPEQHDCLYDHKEKGRQEARQKMVSPKKQVGTSLKRLDSDS